MATDTQLIFNHVNSVAIITDEVKIMAANAAPAAGRTEALKANSMYTINATDTQAVFNAVNGTALDQAALAASHAKYNKYYQ